MKIGWILITLSAIFFSLSILEPFNRRMIDFATSNLPFFIVVLLIVTCATIITREKFEKVNAINNKMPIVIYFFAFLFFFYVLLLIFKSDSYFYFAIIMCVSVLIVYLEKKTRLSEKEKGIIKNINEIRCPFCEHVNTIDKKSNQISCTNCNKKLRY